MIGNTDITIFNIYRNPQTKLDKYTHSYVNNVMWQGVQGCSPESGGVKSNNEITVFIPLSAYGYMENWLENPQSGFWMLQKGAYVMKGNAVELDKSRAYKITKFSVNDFGSKELRHFEVSLE